MFTEEAHDFLFVLLNIHDGRRRNVFSFRDRAELVLEVGVDHFSLLLVCNTIALEYGWWRFESNHSNFLEIPFEVLLGWAAFWGLLPPLVCRGKFIALTILGMVFLDLIVMPQLHPLIVMGPGWLWGELAVILVCLVPGLVLARMTDEVAA